MRRPLLAAALATLAACFGQPVDRVPPLDRFYFPESLAIRHLDASGGDCVGGSPGCTTQLLVVSSNFDLRYDYERGGTLLSVAVPPDPATPPAPADPPLRPPLDVRGAVRIGSLGGTVALVEDRPTLAAQVLGGSERLCAGWNQEPQALVPSRATRKLHRIGLRSDLGLDCQGDCALSLVDPAGDDRSHDPYAVEVTCRGIGDLYRATAFVAFLSVPGRTGVLATLDLGAGSLLGRVGVGDAEAFALAYDRSADRLYFTGRFVGPGLVPFRYLELRNTRTTDVREVNLARQITGAETRGLALSRDGRRTYVALRLYDALLASRAGGRTPDIAGALGVLDMTPDVAGDPQIRLVAAVPVGLGPANVLAVPRRDKRDLVVVSAHLDDAVWLYDDEVGAVAKVLAREPSGAVPRPSLGRRPADMALEARADGRVRIYVASFADHAVSVIDLDPSAPSQARLFMVLEGLPR